MSTTDSLSRESICFVVSPLSPARPFFRKLQQRRMNFVKNKFVSDDSLDDFELILRTTNSLL
jgi:hypothetical protein